MLSESAAANYIENALLLTSRRGENPLPAPQRLPAAPPYPMAAPWSPRLPDD